MGYLWNIKRGVERMPKATVNDRPAASEIGTEGSRSEDRTRADAGPKSGKAASEATGEPKSPSEVARFVRELRSRVGDLLTPSPAIFWSDLFASAALGYGGLAIYLGLPLDNPLAWFGFFAAWFALYRGLMFIHELAHLRRGTFGGFRIAWNVVFGMPLMMPSFLYTEHRTHHTNHSYGTDGDAEYCPIGLGPVSLVAWFVGQGLLVPIFGVLRFALIGPLSFCHPALRRIVWQKASGLTQNNTKFSRPAPTPDQRGPFLALEFGTTLFSWCALALMIAGVVPWFWLLKLYVLFAALTVLSMARALASHLYLNEGDPMSYLDQMFDSTTIPGRPLLTELWAPLGQRYHALHH